jgi:SAM-dependent methyltransferase
MLDSGSFDITYCYMAMGDIADYEVAIAEASRVLKTGGRFVVVMEHPCFMVRSIDGRRIAIWETRLLEDGSKEYLYYRVEDYFKRHSFAVEWKHDRLPSSFVTTGFHRTLSDYVNALVKHGLSIQRLDEPKPMEEGVRVHPPMRKHYRVPHSIVIEAIKTGLDK